MTEPLPLIRVSGLPDDLSAEGAWVAFVAVHLFGLRLRPLRPDATREMDDLLKRLGSLAHACGQGDELAKACRSSAARAAAGAGHGHSELWWTSAMTAALVMAIACGMDGDAVAQETGMLAADIVHALRRLDGLPKLSINIVSRTAAVRRDYLSSDPWTAIPTLIQ